MEYKRTGFCENTKFKTGFIQMPDFRIIRKPVFEKIATLKNIEPNY